MKKTSWLLLLASAFVLAGCGVNALPSKDPWYAQHYFIMQDFERSLYHGLTDNGRLEFQKVFWSERSPAAKAEFDKRVAYCFEAFRRENAKQPWNTDRGRIYVLNGRPAQVEYAQNDNWAMQSARGSAMSGAAGVNARAGEDIQANTLEVWSYPYQQYLISYGFSFQAPNKWTAITMTSGGSRFVGELEMQSRTTTWAPADPEGYARKLEDLKTIL
jgi:GWxTD domain-containing protein